LHPPQHDKHHEPDADDEEPVDGEGKVAHADHAGQRRWRHAHLREGSPDPQRDVGECIAQPDGEHRLLGNLAVQMPEEEVVEGESDETCADGGDHDSEPEGVDLAHHRKAEVGAEHEYGAVRKVQDPHDAERQREPSGEQEQNERIGQTIERADDECAHPPP
jgi:hypothetical protein